MHTRLAERLNQELGTKIPLGHFDAFDELDPQIIEVIKLKGRQTITWEELEPFFNLHRVSPAQKHAIAQSLGINPKPVNRSRKMYTPPSIKKWRVVKNAKEQLDTKKIKALQIYLGLDINSAIKNKIIAVLETDEGESKTVSSGDINDALWDEIMPYLNDDIEIAHDNHNGDWDLDLTNLNKGVPHLVSQITEQTTLPL